MVSLPRTTIALVLAAVCCACAGGAEPGPTSPPDGLSGAQQRLAELAGLAAAVRYDVTYSLRSSAGDEGTMRIAAAPPQFRVDIALRGGDPSTFIQSDGTVVSCSRRGGSATSCLLVARPGEPVPALFDPGVQRLFTDAVADLAARPEQYAVARAAAPTGSSTQAAECFDVRRLDASATASTGPSATATATPADPTGFETGQYCFAPDGVLTRLVVSMGTLELTSRGPAPTAVVFQPPAPPRSLPDLPSPAGSANSP